MTARTTQPEPRPGRSMRGSALGPVVANAVLIRTGAAVRLSSTRAGLPGPAAMHGTSDVAAHPAGQAALTTAIEFANPTAHLPAGRDRHLASITCLPAEQPAAGLHYPLIKTGRAAREIEQAIPEPAAGKFIPGQP